MFTSSQINHLTTLNFINIIDQHVRAVSSIQLICDNKDKVIRVLLLLDVYFGSEKITDLSFDLHNYNYDDIQEIACNIRSNEFLMYEIDVALSGAGE